MSMASPRFRKNADVASRVIAPIWMAIVVGEVGHWISGYGFLAIAVPLCIFLELICLPRLMRAIHRPVECHTEFGPETYYKDFELLECQDHVMDQMMSEMLGRGLIKKEEFDAEYSFMWTALCATCKPTMPHSQVISAAIDYYIDDRARRVN